MVSEKLDVSLLKYCNNHAVRVHAPQLGGPKEEQPQPELLIPLKKINTMLKPPGMKDTKLPLQKKVTNLNIGSTSASQSTAAT